MVFFKNKFLLSFRAHYPPAKVGIMIIHLAMAAILFKKCMSCTSTRSVPQYTVANYTYMYFVLLRHCSEVVTGYITW